MKENEPPIIPALIYTNKCWWCKMPIPDNKKLCDDPECKWEHDAHYV